MELRTRISLDQFHGKDVVWWPDVHTLDDIISNFKLPVLVKVVAGYMINEDECLDSGTILSIHGERQVDKILATDCRMNSSLSIPVDCKIKILYLHGEKVKYGTVKDISNSLLLPSCIENTKGFTYCEKEYPEGTKFLVKSTDEGNNCISVTPLQRDGQKITLPESVTGDFIEVALPEELNKRRLVKELAARDFPMFIMFAPEFYSQDLLKIGKVKLQKLHTTNIVYGTNYTDGKKFLQTFSRDLKVKLQIGRVIVEENNDAYSTIAEPIEDPIDEDILQHLLCRDPLSGDNNYADYECLEKSLCSMKREAEEELTRSRALHRPRRGLSNRTEKNKGIINTIENDNIPPVLPRRPCSASEHTDLKEPPKIPPRKEIPPTLDAAKNSEKARADTEKEDEYKKIADKSKWPPGNGAPSQSDDKRLKPPQIPQRLYKPEILKIPPKSAVKINDVGSDDDYETIAVKQCAKKNKYISESKRPPGVIQKPPRFSVPIVPKDEAEVLLQGGMAGRQQLGSIYSEVTENRRYSQIGTSPQARVSTAGEIPLESDWQRKAIAFSLPLNTAAEYAYLEQEKKIGIQHRPKLPVPNDAELKHIGDAKEQCRQDGGKDLETVKKSTRVQKIESDNGETQGYLPMDFNVIHPSGKMCASVMEKQDSATGLNDRTREKNNQFEATQRHSLEGSKTETSRKEATVNAEEGTVNEAIASNESTSELTEVLEEMANKNMEGVCEILEKIQLGEFVDSFKEMQIDGQLLCDISETDLVSDLQMTQFQARKLLMYIRGWKPDSELLLSSESGLEVPSNWNQEEVSRRMKSIKLNSLGEFCINNQVNGLLLTKILDNETIESMRRDHGVSLSRIQEKKLNSYVFKGWKPT